MAKSKQIHAYAEKLFKLAALVEKDKRVRIPFESKTQAEAFRFEFYGFRNAVRAADAGASLPGIDCIRVKLQEINRGEWSLYFVHTDEDDMFSSLGKILSESAPDQEQSPQASVERRPTPNLDPLESLVESWLGDKGENK